MGYARQQRQQVLGAEPVVPLGVAPHLEHVVVVQQDTQRLLKQGVGVALDRLPRQHRPGPTAPRRVADLGGEVAEQQDDGVAQFLEPPLQPQVDSVAQVQLGRGQVDAVLHPQAPPR
jgi:hypothetical protein